MSTHIRHEGTSYYQLQSIRS